MTLTTHRAASALTSPLTTNMTAMSASNAGIRRNRLRGGAEPIVQKVRLSPEAAKAFSDAASASGNLSLSLYLELLGKQLLAERGTLPILGPQELPVTAA